MKCFGRLVSVFLVVSLALSGPVSANYQFSEYNFSRNPARVDNQMRIQMTGRTALRSFRFVGRVGGVNFEEAVDFSGSSFDLFYDPRLPDGQRAKIDLDGQLLTIPLYDWELLPIANYANSDYTAVVSIFGDGPEPEKYRYIDYHPALEDTHLGMRLLQADILLMDPMVFSEAPSDGARKSYMPGEKAEMEFQQRQVVTLFISLLMQDADFQAWVLTDTDEDPQVSAQGDLLEVDHQPYYYFWKQTENPQAQQKLVLFDEIRQEALQLEKQYEAAYSQYLAAPAGSQTEASALRLARQLESQLEPKIDLVTKLFEEIEGYEPEVEEVTDLTQIIRENYVQVRQIAPFVYDAVEKTAEFSSVFRGLKQENSDEWAEFHDLINANIVLPAVETPNQFSR